MFMEARDVQLVATGVTGCCRFPDVGTWELNLFLLQEQYVFLTTEQSVSQSNSDLQILSILSHDS